MIGEREMKDFMIGLFLIGMLAGCLVGGTAALIIWWLT